MIVVVVTLVALKFYYSKKKEASGESKIDQSKVALQYKFVFSSGLTILCANKNACGM